MITITRKDNPVFDDFASESGVYSCPSVGLSSFATALEAYGYRMDYTVPAGSLYGSVLIEIYQGVIHAGFAHIAWCKYADGRFSVIGRVVR